VSRVTSLLAGTGRADLALALALLVVGLVDVLTVSYRASVLAAVVAVTLQTLPIVWRRSHPLWMVVLGVAGVGVEVSSGAAYGDVAGNLAVLVVIFSTARWAEGTQRRVAAALIAAGVLAHVGSQGLADPGILFANILVIGVGGLGLWWIGSALRAGAARDRDSAAATARAVEAERRAIARDLHDVVGHALAGISLTAGAAQQQAGSRDPEMGEALQLISTLSRDASSDVRHLVGLLRESGDDLPDGPQPQLASIPALVERARSTGLQVSMTERGEPRPAPPGWQLAVVRVVQEGLTNVLRHAPGARAEVTLDWGRDQLTVTVTDDGGRGAAPGGSSRGDVTATTDTGGHGLVGLRERVGLYGGVLTTEASADGFTLTARIPFS